MRTIVQNNALGDVNDLTTKYNNRKGVPELRSPALVCLSAIDKKSVYWSSLLARILNVQDLIKDRTKETSSTYLRCVFLPPSSPVLANIHFLLAYDVPRAEDVGLLTKFRLNVGSAFHSPLLVQCRSIVYDAGPTLIHHWVCCILRANTWHSINAVSMLTHSLRRWPVIETTLGDCTVFSDCCIMLVTY